MHPKTLKKSAVSVPVLSEDGIPILPDEDVEDIVGGDEAAGRFFSDAPVALSSEPVHVLEIEEPARPESAAQSRAERERRRYLTRYVVSAVALSGVICVAAVVHATGGRETPAAAQRGPSPALTPAALVVTAAAVEPKVAPAPAPDPVAAAPMAAAAEPAQTPAAAPAAVEGGVAPAAAAAPASVAESAGAKPDSGSGATTEEPSDPHAALQAKQASQRALDNGKLSLAIEAGERSVQLDASDGEAWLILGAAYLQRGGYAQARRSFASCVQLAKRGPRNECAALLR
jgi:Flp pilus assembly protein TadD